MKVLVVVLVGLVAVPLVAFLGLRLLVSRAPEIDCAAVQDPEPGAWEAGDFSARNAIVVDMSLCERLHGRPRAEVERLLGPPTSARSNELRYELPVPGPGPENTWVIFLDATGRVEDTRYDIVTGL